MRRINFIFEIFVVAFLFMVSGCASLQQRLTSEDDNVRQTAFKEFNGLDTVSKEKLTPVLVDALKEDRAAIEKKIADLDEFARGRAPAAIALVNIGPATVPFLINALKDEDRNIRFRAIMVLRNFGHDAKDAVPALIEALKDKDNVVNREIMKVLRAIGHDAKDAVPTLIETLNNGLVKRYDEESNDAMRTLEKIATPEAENAVAHFKVEKDKQQVEEDKQQVEEQVKANKRRVEETHNLIEAATDCKIKKDIYIQMKYDLEYKTLSKDINRKSTKLQQYRLNTLGHAVKKYSELALEYESNYGVAALRDLAIKNDFLEDLGLPHISF